MDSSAAANPLFSALDIESQKQLGENGHVEHGWSHDATERFTQIYFQLVRAKSQDDTVVLRQNISNLLKRFGSMSSKDLHQQPEHYQLFMNLYKLIGHTRDIESKGERQLAYAQVWVWYKFSPELALHAVRSFVHYIEEDGEANSSKHQYGSWNDIKYLSEAIKSLAGTEDHPIIDYAISLLVDQLYKDMKTPEGESISLAARHAPRENGRFDWLFKKIAMEMYPYNTTARTAVSLKKAKTKAWMHLRKNILSPLNKRLDTVQIKMAAGVSGEGEWDKIDFNKVTSKTMRMYSKAWQNKKKDDTQRTDEDHRIACASNFKAHIDKALSGDKTAKVHGKRCNTYEFVKDAIACSHQDETEKARINLQWESNSENNKGLGNMIAVCDVSGSMTCDDCIPLYNAIGIGIRISEKASPSFRDRMITFSTEPTWINLSNLDNFHSKVHATRVADWLGTTDIYKTFRMVLDAIVKSGMPPVEVENMVIIVLSDMQINQGSSYNDTLHENIVKMFADAGLASKFAAPFSPPHLVWWNLRVTDGFPTLSTTKNCSMLSGYNATLLNSFESKGIDALKDYTPYKMMSDILSESRYNMLGRHFQKHIDKLN